MIDYISVNSKICAMLDENIFKKEDFDILLGYTNRQDFIQFLAARQRFKTIFEKENFAGLTIQRFEILSVSYIISIYNSLKNYFFNNSKLYNFFKIYFLKYEIKNIKIIINCIIGKIHPEKIREQLYNLKGCSSLNFNSLLTSVDIAALIESFQNTIYGKTLSDALIIYEKTKCTLPFENALDYLYWHTLFKAASGMSVYDSKIILDILSKRLDYINISMIFRTKFHFLLSIEEIKLRKLSFTNYKSSIDLNELLNADDKTVFFEKLKNSCYSYMAGDPLEFEKKFNRRMIELFSEFKKKTRLNAGLLFLFFIRVEFEQKNLSSVFEKFEFKVSAQELKKLLIF